MREFYSWITLVSGLLLGLVFTRWRRIPLRCRRRKPGLEARQEVFQDADHFEDGEGFSRKRRRLCWMRAASRRRASTNTALPMTRDGGLLGYVITVTSHEGLRRDIKFTIGVRMDNTLNGMSILSISRLPAWAQAEEVLKPSVCRQKAGKLRLYQGRRFGGQRDWRHYQRHNHDQCGHKLA